MADLDRILKTARALQRCGCGRWIVVGSVGANVRLKAAGRNLQPAADQWNDIDFATRDFEDIPEVLASRMLFRHVHPGAAVGQMFVQFVDPATSLRVDVFRASEGTIGRACDGTRFAGFAVVSAEDAAAHALRIALDVAYGVAVPEKYVDDAIALHDIAAAPLVDLAWADHRKTRQPVRYEGAFRVFDASRASVARAEPASSSASPVCERCVTTTRFGLAEPSKILSYLGYL